MKKVFTLIELIVVIAIIAVLAAIIAPNAFKAIEKAKISEAAADLKTYKNAILAFYADTGDWPLAHGRNGYMSCLEDNGLMTNINNWSGWDGPYLEKVKSADPWNGMYCFQFYDEGRGPAREFAIELNRCCYPSVIPASPTCISDKCFIPDESAQRFDATFDDGDTSDGNLFYERFTAGVPLPVKDFLWIITWDTQ